jgi:hypothetical protein
MNEKKNIKVEIVAYFNVGDISCSYGDENEDVFWDVVPCGLVEVYRRSTCACCLHHQDDAVNKH